MTYLTRDFYIAAAGQTEFPVNFEYLEADHVTVTVNGAVVPFEWLMPNRIKLATPATVAARVDIRRKTPFDQSVVTFSNGSHLTAEELNTAQKQLLFVVQEWADLYNNSLEGGLIDLGNGLGVIGDNPQDILDQLVAIALLGNDLTNRLWQRIAEIDQIAETVFNNTIRDVWTRNKLEELTYDANGIAVLDRVTELRDGQNVLVEDLSLIGARNANGSAFVLNADTVKLSETESLAQHLTVLQANAANYTNARVTEVQQALASANAATAAMGTQLQANIGNVSASVVTLSNAMTTADEAFAQSLSLLGVKNATGTAWLLDESKVLLANGVSMGSRLSGITAAIAGANAAVATEVSARTSADGALSSRIDTVQAGYDGLSSSVTTLSEASSLYGSRWGVSLTSGGKVSGLILNNGGGTSTADFLTDALRISNTSGPGGTVITPFRFEGSTAYLQSVVAENIAASAIQAGSITADKIAANQITADKIVANNIAEITGSLNDGDVVLNSSGFSLVGHHAWACSGGRQQLNIWVNVRASSNIGVRFYAAIYRNGSLIGTTRAFGDYIFEGDNGNYNSLTFSHWFNPGGAGTCEVYVYGIKGSTGGTQVKDACTITVMDHKTSP